jgi:hypothetical protein
MSRNHRRKIDFKPRYRNMLPYGDYIANREKYLRLGEKAIYTGNPFHKRNPGDYKLNPPFAARYEKTLCDIVNITKRDEATKLLREAFRRGLVSAKKEIFTDIWPKFVWALTADGDPVEAMYDGRGYHGYPISNINSPLFDEIVKRWNNVNYK